jgi:hypothetical protein
MIDSELEYRTRIVRIYIHIPILSYIPSIDSELGYRWQGARRSRKVFGRVDETEPAMLREFNPTHYDPLQLMNMAQALHRFNVLADGWLVLSLARRPQHQHLHNTLQLFSLVNVFAGRTRRHISVNSYRGANFDYFSFRLVLAVFSATSWRTVALQGVAVECDPAIPRSPNFAVAVALSQSARGRSLGSNKSTPVNFIGLTLCPQPQHPHIYSHFLFLRLPRLSHSFHHTSRDLSARDMELHMLSPELGLRGKAATSRCKC